MMTNDLAIRILSGDILGTTEQTHEAVAMAVKALSALPASPVREVVLCKDCLFGHLYIDVVNGESDSWVECRNPDGLNRDVSMDEFCSASIRRQENEEMQEVANLDAFYGEALND